MSAVLAVDKLTGNAHTRAGFSNASFQDKADPELLSYLLNLHRFTLVSKRGIAGDDEEPGHLRQIGDDVLGDAITEIFLLRVAAHIVERENRNRWPLFPLCWRGAVGFPSGGAVQPNAINANWPFDVL